MFCIDLHISIYLKTQQYEDKQRVDRYQGTDIKYLLMLVDSVFQESFLILNRTNLENCFYERICGTFNFDINMGEFLRLDVIDHYPFGQLKQVPSKNTKVQVQQKLFYQSAPQLQDVKRMAKKMEEANHENLIKLECFHIQNHGEVNFYYEYVPLSFESWILSIGEHLVTQLEGQMIKLAIFLNSKGIEFVFNPKCMGLSQNIRVKYFLQEFEIRNSRKINDRIVVNQIRDFFKEFKEDKKHQLTCSTIFTDRKSSDSKLLTKNFRIFQGRQTWGVEDSFYNCAANKQEDLRERVSSLMKRSKEVLSKLRSIKTISQKSQYKLTKMIGKKTI